MVRDFRTNADPGDFLPTRYNYNWTCWYIYGRSTPSLYQYAQQQGCLDSAYLAGGFGLFVVMTGAHYALFPVVTATIAGGP